MFTPFCSSSRYGLDATEAKFEPVDVFVNQCRGIRRFLGDTSDAEEYWLGKVDASKKKHLQMQTDAYAKWAVMEMLAHVLVIRVRAYC